MTERGFAGPVVIVVAALVVMALGGISVDLWRVVDAHEELAAAADAAATAAAASADEESLRRRRRAVIDPERAIERACEVLTGVGLVCSDAQIDVDERQVTVRVRRRVRLAFVGALRGGASGAPEFEVAASARAALFRGTP